MRQDTPLSIFDISRELGIGTANTKFLINRFNRHMGGTTVDGKRCYPKDTVGLLLNIKSELDMGHLPSEVEEKLDNHELDHGTAETGTHLPLSEISIPPSQLKSILSNIQAITFQQERMALAQEARNQIEERKAQAMEKRAQEESRKADAMDDIATALQSMSHTPDMGNPDTGNTILQQAMDEMNLNASDLELSPTLSEEPSQGIEILPQDDLSEFMGEEGLPLVEQEDAQTSKALLEQEILEENLEKTLSHFDEITSEDISQVVESFEMEEQGLREKGAPEDTEGLTEILDAPSYPETEQDELNELIDTVSSESGEEAMDDLSQLVASASQVDGPENDMDDLGLLVDETDNPAPPEGDAGENSQAAAPMDNLAQLVESASEDGQEEMDNLNLLVEEPEAPHGTPVDRLETSNPAEAPVGSMQGEALHAADSDKMDDLAQLVESRKPEEMEPTVHNTLTSPPEQPEPMAAPVIVKPRISPKDDIKQYKSAIMKIIYELKTKGLSPEEATQGFNKQGIETLSGRPQWQVNAMSKIYALFDAAGQ